MKNATISLGVMLALTSMTTFAQQHPTPLVYSSTFQSTDYGAIDANGLSAERFQGNVATTTLTAPSDQVSPHNHPKTEGVSIINRNLPSTRTKLYVWKDARGVTHYSDRASSAPKTAQTKVVVTVQPPHTPPLRLYKPIPQNEGDPIPQGPQPEIDGHIAPPPTSLPPSSLPPIPPGV